MKGMKWSIDDVNKVLANSDYIGRLMKKITFDMEG